MDPNKTALERAFDLARSGTCETILALVRQLSKEGYPTGQIDGRTLKRQLAALIKQSYVRIET